MNKKRVYLDHNSTSPLLPGVAEAMLPYLNSFYGNPSSVHHEGRQARHGIEESRTSIAKLIGARRDQIIFTSGGSEAINLAMKGVGLAFQNKGKHIITTSVEHSASIRTCEYLADTFGFSLSVLPVNGQGCISLEDLKKAIRPETILISMIHAQNEIGTLQPIEDVIRIAHEKNILVHIDGVQAVGKIPVSVEKWGVDLYSFSSHKIGGPKGVGALFLKDDLKIHALIHGGHHERDLRAGTENVPGIVGFAKAASLTIERGLDSWKRIFQLKQKLYDGLMKTIPGCFINGDLNLSLPNTLHCSFENVDGLALLFNLDLEGISVSSGSACLSGSIEPSRILLALGLSPALAQGGIRFSLGIENTKEEIDITIETIERIVKRLRKS